MWALLHCIGSARRTLRIITETTGLWNSTILSSSFPYIMAALWNRACHYIFILCFLLLSSLSSIFFHLFFLAYSQPSQNGCLPYFHTWCGLSVNLGCRSETCCMVLAKNTGRKKSPKIRHLGTIAKLCWAVIFAMKPCIDNQKKGC